MSAKLTGMQILTNALPMVTESAKLAITADKAFGSAESKIEGLAAEIVASGALKGAVKKGEIDKSTETYKQIRAAWFAPVCDDSGAILPKFKSDEGKRIGSAKTLEGYFSPFLRRLAGKSKIFRFTAAREAADAAPKKKGAQTKRMDWFSARTADLVKVQAAIADVLKNKEKQEKLGISVHQLAAQPLANERLADAIAMLSGKLAK
jgi:hypothetical protein